LFSSGYLSAEHTLGIIPHLPSLKYVELTVSREDLPEDFKVTSDEEGWAEMCVAARRSRGGFSLLEARDTPKLIRREVEILRSEWEARLGRLEKELGREQEARPGWQPPKIVFSFIHEPELIWLCGGG
jgi:hypothetical protein